MYHGSLFSGGGGFDLAAETVGWQNIFHCEKDEFCQTILKHYWPNAHSYDDIKDFDATSYRRKIDVLTGGFPCQPFSIAGQRRGTEDDRYLWPEMLRVISEVRPRWIVGENVLGLVNWNEGLVFRQVLSDLEAQGYSVQPFVLPAAGVNAPHQRYRVWIIAFNGQYSTCGKKKVDSDSGSDRWRQSASGSTFEARRDTGECQQPHSVCKTQLAQANPDTDSTRLERRKNCRGPGTCGSARYEQSAGFANHNQWRTWPTQSPLCSGDDGFPTLLDGITIPKWRNQSIKLYGNAIVPQVAAQIFKAIEQYEALLA